MSTSWEEIEVRATTYIKNDLSLDWDKANRPAVFYNRMKAYMLEAITVFNRPPEMLGKLSAYLEPYLESHQIETIEESGDWSFDTGITGAGIVSAGIITTDSFGDVEYTPVPVAYDADNGDITLTGPFTAGQTLDLDFYFSGSFDADLNETEKGILAFAIYNRYEHRFDNDVLERQAKIRDSAFTTISEASQTQAGTSRQREVDSQLNGMMRAYQDNIEYLRLKNGSV